MEFVSKGHVIPEEFEQDGPMQVDQLEGCHHDKRNENDQEKDWSV